MQGIEFTPRTDPITHEVLRHRLWQINYEQGRTIVNVSGSPVAAESLDFNVGIADRAGNIVCVGPYLLSHVTALSLGIRAALELLEPDGVEQDAMYLANDPWLGAIHQNDVFVLAPVHWEGQLVAWTGSTIHLWDVGGAEPQGAGTHRRATPTRKRCAIDSSRWCTEAGSNLGSWKPT